MAVCFFENTEAMRVIFFSKFWKINVDLKNSENRGEKVICLWDNYISIGCVNLSQLRSEYSSSAVNASKTVLRLYISLRESFSNSISFTLINKYDKDAVAQISTVFGKVYLSKGLFERSSQKGLFRRLSDHVLCTL